MVLRRDGRTYVRVTWLRGRSAAMSHSRNGRSYLAAVRELQLAAARLRAAGAYPGGMAQVAAFRAARTAWVGVLLTRHRLQR